MTPKEQERTLAATEFLANIQLKVTQRAVDKSDMSWDCARCTMTTEAPNEMVWIELEGVGNWAVCKPCWAEIAEQNATSTSKDETVAELAAKIQARIEHLRPDTAIFMQRGFEADAYDNINHIKGLEEALAILTTTKKAAPT